VMLTRRRLYEMSLDEQLRMAQPQADQLHETPQQVPGAVMGGVHVGGGRSVAPRRDEAVVPYQPAAGETGTPESHR
jgi:hypothetical protein